MTVEDIARLRLPRYAQIPDIGLYLEQVVSYVNSFLAPLGEPGLTTSMVSNYVKQRLVPAPRKKLYAADHLARLMFIAVVKPVVPLDGLRLMFDIQGEGCPLPAAYDYFCDEFERMLRATFGVAPAAEGPGGADEPADPGAPATSGTPFELRADAKTLLRNTILATVSKVYLDRYLSEYRRDRAAEGTPEVGERA